MASGRGQGGGLEPNGKMNKEISGFIPPETKSD
jgi:hypothetical protein